MNSELDSMTSSQSVDMTRAKRLVSWRHMKLVVPLHAIAESSIDSMFLVSFSSVRPIGSI